MDLEAALRTTLASTVSPTLSALGRITAPLRLLDLDYAPEVPDQAIARMERIAREAGMPLAQIELLGQDATACWEFTHLAQTVSVEGAILHTDWLRLDAIFQARQQLAR